MHPQVNMPHILPAQPVILPRIIVCCLYIYVHFSPSRAPLHVYLPSAHRMYMLHTMTPLVGLKYAQETGREDGSSPAYKCTLCEVQSDPGNRLHFTSAAHRMNVLVRLATCMEDVTTSHTEIHVVIHTNAHGN